MQLSRLTIAFACAAAVAQECQITPLTDFRRMRIQEGELLGESDTVQLATIRSTATGTLYFQDFAARIRRLDADGRLRTVAGNGHVGAIRPGPAMQSPLPSLYEMRISPAGDPFLFADGMVFRLSDRTLIQIAGSGKRGFNGDAATPAATNLGDILDIAIARNNDVYILDGHGRVRHVTTDGKIATIAGSYRRPDNEIWSDGPATSAYIGGSGGSHIFVAPDGLVWIQNGSRIRVVGADGVLRAVSLAVITFRLFQSPGGVLFASTSNGLFPVDATDFSTPAIRTGPQMLLRAMSHDGGVYATTERDLLKITPNGETVVASIRPAAVAPREPLAPAWDAGSQTAYFSGTLNGRSGIIRLRLGQAPRLLAELPASAVAVAGDGRVFAKSSGGLVEVFQDGTVRPLMGLDGPLRIGPLDFGQSIAAESGGLLYWVAGSGRVDFWEERTRAVVPIYFSAPEFLTNFADGSVAVWVLREGFRKLSRAVIGPPALDAPILSARWMTPAGFGVSTNSRLVQLRQFSADWITLEELASPDFFGSARIQVEAVTPIPNGALVRLTAGQFGGVIHIDGIDSCKRISLPFIATEGITSAAGFGFSGNISSYQLLTLFGNNLGPKEGSGMLFDRFGSLTAANGRGVEVLSPDGGPSHHVSSTDTQFTVTTYSLIESFPGLDSVLPPRIAWQSDGIRWTHPLPLRRLDATPGLFITGGLRDGPAACLNQDGSINTASNPAPAGSVIQFFAGGLGNVEPALEFPTDFFSTTTLHLAKSPSAMLIANRPAEIIFAGGAPGQLVGVYQVNAKIPEGTPPGPASVELTVAGQSTSRFQKVTVFVR